MLQLRNPVYAGLAMIEELDQDESNLTNGEIDPNIMDTPVGLIYTENGDYILDLAKKIVKAEGELFENLFDIKSAFPMILKGLTVSREKGSLYNLFSPSSIFQFIVKNQGEENCIRDIVWLLLKNPYKLPEEIVAWEIPEFDDEIPPVERILLIRKL